MPAPDPRRVDRRFAQAYVAELLAGLGVAQDESTAEGLLDAAVDVQRARRQGVGEVIVVTFAVDPQPDREAGLPPRAPLPT
jgi:hypothetical protein